MQTSLDFLRAVQARHGLTSDGQLARKLGVTRSCVSRYVHGKDALGDSTALKVAELLEMDPAEVLAAVHFERAKTEPEKAVWKEIINRLGGVAAGVFIAVALLSLAPHTDAGAAPLMLLGFAGNTHYANFGMPPVYGFGYAFPLICMSGIFSYLFPSRRSARWQ